MDKILSKDTIKNVFSALGAKTSDSNYGVALLDKTSGEPKGLMGMSDLASVLGVGNITGNWSTANGNFLNMPTGFHYGNYNEDNWNTLNAPMRYGHITMCYNNGGTGDSVRKFFVSIGETGTDKLYIRRVWGSYDSGWKTISLT